MTDASLMPYGIHKGKRMQDVPADYLHYLWTHGKSETNDEVAEYIRSNLDVLKLEYKDGIWE